jgi:glucose/arabinose dehydrogenase
MTSKTMLRLAVVASLICGSLVYLNRSVDAQLPAPEMIDTELSVRAAVAGLTTPIGIAFLDNRRRDRSDNDGDNDQLSSDDRSADDRVPQDVEESSTNRRAASTDMFVIEKQTGQVKLVVNGAVTATVLDLAVNFASERGLLSIALHPRFPRRPFVYLYWTCRTAAAPPDPFRPSARTCDERAMLGEDTNEVLQVPLLGNRVDRFVWNGKSLTFDRNIISLRSFQNDAASEPPGQNDAAQNPGGNHNGGVIRFGHDGKLYVIVGDVGRRGWLQNLAQGPTPTSDDDQFGGPEPDNAHLTGVVLRLNDDGSTPRDNPFADAADRIQASRQADRGVVENIRKVFAYGFRNSFGMAFDPFSRRLWVQVNGDDTFDEIQRVDPGLNSGWIQTIGPISRIGEFKQIETTRPPQQLQQLRWPPTNLADTPDQARTRLFMLPGATYHDPQFSWRYAVAPAGIGFVRGFGLGAGYIGDLFVGASTPLLEGGYLFRFNLTRNRADLNLEAPGLADRVADNNDKHDLTGSESLLVGRNFGVSTDIESGPNGNLFVVSISRGEVLEIFRPGDLATRQR